MNKFTCDHCNQTVDESEQCWTRTEFCKNCVDRLVDIGLEYETTAEKAEASRV